MSKRKMHKIILIVISLFLLSGCGFDRRMRPIKGTQLKEESQYVFKGRLNKSIYYQVYSPPQSTLGSYDYIKIPKADVSSFRVLNLKEKKVEFMEARNIYMRNEGDIFAVDNNNLYCKGEKIDIQLDTATARFLTVNLLIDDERVYWTGFDCPDDGKIKFDVDMNNEPIILNPKTTKQIYDEVIMDDEQIYMRVKTKGLKYPSKYGWKNLLDEISYEKFDGNLITDWGLVWLKADDGLKYILPDNGETVIITDDPKEIESFKRVGNTRFFHTNNAVFSGYVKTSGVLYPQNFKETSIKTIFTDEARYYYYDGNNGANQNLTLLKEEFTTVLGEYTPEMDISEYYEKFLE